MKVFLDTNIVYKLYRAYVRNQGILTYSQIRNSWHSFIVSTYVLFELETICQRSRTLLPIEHIPRFLEYMNIRVTLSSSRESIYTQYVHDPDDVQIIQDACLSRAEYLLTANIADFLRTKIERELWCHVTVELPQ